MGSETCKEKEECAGEEEMKREGETDEGEEGSEGGCKEKERQMEKVSVRA